MNDPDFSARNQNAISFPEQTNWIFCVQDIEQHHKINCICGEASSVFDKITLLANHVSYSSFFDFCFTSIDHHWINIESINCSTDISRGRDGEQPITAAKIDHRSAGPIKPNSSRIKSGLKNDFHISSSGIHSRVFIFLP